MDTISLTPFGLFESVGLVGRAVMILLGLVSQMQKAPPGEAVR